MSANLLQFKDLQNQTEMINRMERVLSPFQQKSSLNSLIKIQKRPSASEVSAQPKGLASNGKPLLSSDK